jgi:uncharacterized protein YjbI with pentapeptide repeats
MKKKDFFIIFLGAIIPWMIYLIINDKIELANFLVTTLAFFAAGYAIYLQKEATLKQEIIGAWQVLANKASGNSGKKEAIEFLASQGLSLCGIDMSHKTHGGRVYLADLFKDFKGDRSKIDLRNANFSGASLLWADFSGVDLFRVDFSGADFFRVYFSGSFLQEAEFSGVNLQYADFLRANLYDASFSRANLGGANFSGAKLYNKKGFDKGFTDCYCSFHNYHLPKPPPGYKFEFEERTNENNQPIYPENNPDYRYIKLIKLK